jgi:hypothetical protein
MDEPMKWCLPLLLAISTSAGAVVIRTDVRDANYRIPAAAFPALVDLPGEGHGVLIAPTWVVTAAHAVSWQSSVDEVSIAGQPRKVARIFKYPGYRRLPDSISKEALATGDASNAYIFLAHTNDIALIELATPVMDVAPVPLYRGSGEYGRTVEIVGKGATGNGTDGEVPHGPHRTELRHAFNVVTGVDAHWLWYTFDSPTSALPLEGIAGGGDSGGPVILEDHGEKRLVGLASWNKYPRGLQGGLYGQVVYNVRVAGYVAWIEDVIADREASTEK